MPEKTMKTFLVAAILYIPYSIQTAAQKCEHLSIDYFDCVDKNITSFPSNIPFGIKYLNISHNKLNHFPRANFKSPSSLVTFNLSHNELVTIDRYAFKNMSGLVELDLSYNNLQGSSLVVEEYRLEMGIFPSLKNLTLRRNPLGTLLRLTFTSFGYRKLERLDLSQCSLKTLEHLAINDLSRLKVLNLSHNLLEVLDSMSIAGIIELEVLDLSYNRLVIIQDMPSAFSLHTILLGNNLVRGIKDNVFQVVKGLKTLSLERNQLRNLNHLSVPWDTVDTLVLDKNPWFCNCHMRWILDFKEQYSRNFSMICLYPSRLRGRSVFTLYRDDMSCSISLLKVIVTLALALVCFTVISGTFMVLYYKRDKLRNLCRKGDGVKGRYVAVFTNDNGEADSQVNIQEDKKALAEQHNTEIYA